MSTPEWPETPEEMAALAGRLEFTDEEVELPPTPGPDGIMVSRSLKMPSELDQRIKTAAADRGITQSMLMRQLLETGLAAIEHDHPISLTDAIRALSGLSKSA
ncbi:CopG family transcriptional regulator [Nocardia sp. NPDC023852]|uniref:ribbon-helix-helix domain-containing protein n=1 Tax=unclassified Nocardia TaxID=2637762 RepID=UPI0033C08CCA|nr:ribbon-helix-helix domain-containing protein [Nocardia sp. NBC_00881]